MPRTRILQDRINETQLALDALRREQELCNHAWGDVIKGSYLAREQYDTGRREQRGIHIENVMGTRDIFRPDWTRTCTRCGKFERTTEQRERVPPTVYEPDFKEKT